ncbi:hypothetical protein D9611_007205 [Ephemerocybe angulata]|uniref:phytol kinase n=1 Tax=Ephemerocybe angulata TaxID=980116 RepID=A0A8H5B0P7_9AGAR|nr:hypothetical protein D9611_007205 [Tulosesus angulatus]
MNPRARPIRVSPHSHLRAHQEWLTDSSGCLVEAAQSSNRFLQEYRAREREMAALEQKPYTLKTLDDLLAKLQIDDIPNRRLFKDWVDRAVDAFSALGGVILVVQRCMKPGSTVSPSTRRATIDRLLASFDLIEGWACYWTSPEILTSPRLERITPFTPPSLTHPQTIARFLLVLLSFDPSISKRFCASTTSIDLVLRLWTQTEGKSDNTQPYEYETEGACTIVRLMLHCVQEDSGDGLAAFIDRIGSREAGFPRHVAQRTLQRLDAAHRALERHGGTDEILGGALGYTRDVVHIIDRLATDPLMQRAFEHHDYARKLTEAFQGFLKPIEALDPTKYVDDLGTCVSVMVQAILCSAQSNRPRNLALALEHGLMDMLVWLLKVSQAWEDGPHNLVFCLSGLASYLPWTAVLLQLRAYYKVRLEVEKEAGRISGGIVGDLGREWRRFNVALWEHFQAHSLWDGKVRLCDNLECQRATHRGNAPASLPTSKECAGCSAFVYCGELCQRKDWDARHSKECASARIDSIIHRATPGAWYSPRQRAYHVALIEHRFNAFLERCTDPYYFIARAYEKGMTAPTFGAAALAFLEQKEIRKRSRFFHLTASSVYGLEVPFMEIKQGQYPSRPLPCATQLGYLQPRMDEYLKESGALKGEFEIGNNAQDIVDRRMVKYVECSFKFSESREVHVMVKMRLDWDMKRVWASFWGWLVWRALGEPRITVFADLVVFILWSVTASTYKFTAQAQALYSQGPKVGGYRTETTKNSEDERRCHDLKGPRRGRPSRSVLSV